MVALVHTKYGDKFHISYVVQGRIVLFTYKPLAALSHAGLNKLQALLMMNLLHFTNARCIMYPFLSDLNTLQTGVLVGISFEVRVLSVS